MMYHESWPDEEIDHIDGNRSNNIISNLRPVTRSENQRNAKLRCTNTSGVMGVTDNGVEWVTTWMENGKQQTKSFKTFEEAVDHRKQMELKHNYHPNHRAQNTRHSND